MQRLKDLFKDTPVHRSLIDSQKIYAVLWANWNDIMGDLTKDIALLFVKGKTVYVEVYNPIWVKEIEFFKEMLLKKMNHFSKKTNRLTAIHVQYSQSLPHQENKQDPTSYTSLKDAILEVNRLKIKQGYAPCVVCARVLTLQKECSFCRCENR
jgi:hypothetical protein